MIPKIIHYCWFGGNPLPDLAQKCIDSWKKFCPDYEIIRWDESNYDVHKNQFVENAYRSKKWAFLTDYVRLDVVYQMGGVYLDTDVELIKPLDSFLSYQCYMGMEQPGRVNTGLGFGSEKQHPFLLDNMKEYENTNFVRSNGKFSPQTCVDITSKLLEMRGLKKSNSLQIISNVVILPVDFLCPQDMETGKLVITDNSYSIHHYSASWKNNFDMFVYKVGIVLKKIIGENLYKEIAEIKHKLIG